jgi:hypothetical protein
VSATLTVKRESIIMELRRAPLQIALDGATVGTINRHETFEAPVEPGRHRLQVQTGRYSSQTESFDVADGDAVNFRCSGARIWPIYLASFAVPSLALSLKRE